MLTIDHSASTGVAATPERCLAILSDVAGYPGWSSLIRSAEELGGDKVRLRAELFGISFEMDCVLEVGADRVELRRVPYDAQDDERYVATWTVSPVGTGAAVELHVVAALEAPGPASLLRGRVQQRLVDDLLADFARAVPSR
jgi:hypothetical protein